MIEIVLSQAQVPGVGFLRSVHGVALCDKVHSCEVRKALKPSSL